MHGGDLLCGVGHVWGGEDSTTVHASAIGNFVEVEETDRTNAGLIRPAQVVARDRPEGRQPSPATHCGDGSAATFAVLTGLPAPHRVPVPSAADALRGLARSPTYETLGVNVRYVE